MERLALEMTFDCVTQPNIITSIVLLSKRCQIAIICFESEKLVLQVAVQ